MRQQNPDASNVLVVVSIFRPGCSKTGTVLSEIPHVSQNQEFLSWLNARGSPLVDINNIPITMEGFAFGFFSTHHRHVGFNIGGGKETGAVGIRLAGCGESLWEVLGELAELAPLELQTGMVGPAQKSYSPPPFS